MCSVVPHDLAARMSAVTSDAEPVLLLTHNPDVFPSVPERVTLTIAGHTHGGQVQLPWIGAPIVPSRFGQRFAAGLCLPSGTTGSLTLCEQGALTHSHRVAMPIP